MKRIAFYGGSFDPPHNGHLAIARNLTEIFALDEFVFIPAFHAPHKKAKKMTAPFCRYAMLALATNDDKKIKISTVELDAPERPFTFETQAKLIDCYDNAVEIFFVIGADSWNEIATWREWQKVLTQTNIIVVTRPNYEIEFGHIGSEIENSISDLRAKSPLKFQVPSSKFQVPSPKSKVQSPKSKKQMINDELGTWNLEPGTEIYLTDAVQMNVSATEIRRNIKAGEMNWRSFVPTAVADYIEKYRLYI